MFLPRMRRTSIIFVGTADSPSYLAMEKINLCLIWSTKYTSVNSVIITGNQGS